MTIKQLINELLEAPSLESDVVVEIGQRTFELDSITVPPSYQRTADVRITMDADNDAIAEAVGATVEE